MNRDLEELRRRQGLDPENPLWEQRIEALLLRLTCQCLKSKRRIKAVRLVKLGSNKKPETLRWSRWPTDMAYWCSTYCRYVMRDFCNRRDLKSGFKYRKPIASRETLVGGCANFILFDSEHEGWPEAGLSLNQTVSFIEDNYPDWKRWKKAKDKSICRRCGLKKRGEL